MRHPRLGQAAIPRIIAFLGFQIDFLDFQILFLGLETSFGGILIDSGEFLSFGGLILGLKSSSWNIFNRVSLQKSAKTHEKKPVLKKPNYACKKVFLGNNAF